MSLDQGGVKAVRAAADAAGLGEFVRAYPDSRWSSRDDPDLSVVWVVLLVALLTVPLDIFLAATFVGAWLVLVLIAFGVAAVTALVRRFKKPTGGDRVRSIAHFNGGLVCARGDEATPIAWSEVTEIYQDLRHHTINGKYMFTSATYDLVTRDGQRIRLHGIQNNDKVKSDIVQLGPVVVNSVIGRLLPGVVEAIRSGNTVDFGPISARPDGVQTPAGLVPWGNAEAFALERGVLKVRVPRAIGARRWKREVRRIPNLVVLLALLRLGPIIAPR